MKSGGVVPFLGAGASMTGRQPNLHWDPEAANCLPSGLELARFLAENVVLPSTDPRDREDLAKVCSYFADIMGRDVLRQRLRTVLNHTFEPTVLHEFLGCLPGNQVYVVTNYDTLLEQALRAAGKPYDLVIYPADRADYAGAVLWWPHGAAEPKFPKPNALPIDLATTNVIYKMHGSVMPDHAELDNFVITEEDYINFLTRMKSAVPNIFYEHFKDRRFLFLGYSLRDWNLRVVLKTITNRLPFHARGGHQSWAIQRQPTELETLLWRNREVWIFDMDLEEFTSKMRTHAKMT